MIPALLEVLKLDTWKRGLAAWVLAGYSPLLLKEHAKIIRLKDEKNYFGAQVNLVKQNSNNWNFNHCCVRNTPKCWMRQ